MGVFPYKKCHRLTRRQDFVRLSHRGPRAENSWFIAAFRPALGPETRLGVTVTRKVGCAVVRNRIKRLVREYFRLHRHLLSPPHDVNVIAKAVAKNADNATLFAALEDIFGRVGKAASR